LTTIVIKDPSTRPPSVEIKVKLELELDLVVVAVAVLQETKTQTSVATVVLALIHRAAAVAVSEVHSPSEVVLIDRPASATIRRWVETLMAVTATVSTNNFQPLVEAGAAV
jgi:hypothetical protein